MTLLRVLVLWSTVLLMLPPQLETWLGDVTRVVVNLLVGDSRSTITIIMSTMSVTIVIMFGSLLPHIFSIGVKKRSAKSVNLRVFTPDIKQHIVMEQFLPIAFQQRLLSVEEVRKIKKIKDGENQIEVLIDVLEEKGPGCATTLLKCFETKKEELMGHAVLVDTLKRVLDKDNGPDASCCVLIPMLVLLSVILLGLINLILDLYIIYIPLWMMNRAVLFRVLLWLCVVVCFIYLQLLRAHIGPPMKREEREYSTVMPATYLDLRGLMPAFEQYIIMEEFLAIAFKRGLVSTDEIKEVQKREGRVMQLSYLIDLLERKGPEFLATMMSCFEEHVGHAELEDVLQRATEERCYAPQRRNTVFPPIHGADIIAQTKIGVFGDMSLTCMWEGHGFKAHIPAGAVSEERGPVTLCIQASLSGDYQLPDDGVLVSGVYWLSLHPHVERFHKKVTVSIQHCASDDDPELSFVTAKCTQKTRPYTFKPLPGGSFSQSGEGTIQVDHFSMFAVLFRKVFGYTEVKKRYAFCTYYIHKHLNCYEAHITVTPDLELQLKGVEKRYEEDEMGPSISASIQENEVALNFNPDLGFGKGAWEHDGWELKLLIKPAKLPKETLDGYQPGQVIPHFAIQMKLKDRLNPRPLSQEVEFVGVDLPNCIVLSRDPAPQAFLRRKPTLSQLSVLWNETNGRRIEIIRSISPRWRETGARLDFDPTGATLNQIEADHRGVESCCRAMFQHWLEGNGVQPASWATLIQILNDCKFVNLAAQVRDALIQ